ncbi:peptidoglycan-binding protein [Streptomyces variabilis]
MPGGIPLTVSILSRKSWGAKPWNGSPATIPLSKRTEFFVHYHGGIPAHSTGLAVPREVEKIHLANGWAGTGYNFMVDQNGVIYEGRGWSLQGAHCPNHNVSGFGVYVAVGGDQAPTDKALSSVRALYDEACRRTGRNLAKKGHKDGYATTCPGNHLYAWVKAGMPVDNAGMNGSTTRWDGKSFPGRGAFVLGRKHDAVTLLGERLIAHGYGSHYKVGPGPRFGEADLKATKAFQEAQGWSGSDADGYPGPTTWSRLMAAPKAPPSVVALSSEVRPGAWHPQVKELQRLLIKAGYGPIKGAVTDYYGMNTQAAVARFHNRNPKCKSAGLIRDPKIGPRGFTALQKQAGRR